jgi:uncharacterized heparinase superfamily protein
VTFRLVRDLRWHLARLPRFRLSLPENPVVSVRDPWPGDATRGARLLRGELYFYGAVRPLKPGGWADTASSATLRAHAHGFTWLRDLREIGTDAARMRARALVADWIEAGREPIAHRPDVAGARITAWLAHFDFFAASADDSFRARMMRWLIADARQLAASLPAEEMDGRALTALKGVIAASISFPEHVGFLIRAQRFLPQEIARQVLADGGHAERSPAAQLEALKNLIEIRAQLHLANAPAPVSLSAAIDSLSATLRMMRHGDGSLALFNGTRDESAPLLDLVLAQTQGQAARFVRGGPASLPETGFYRLQAGATVLIVDAGAPPPAGMDRLSHAGTLSFELSVNRTRMIVNCGAAPVSGGAWADAARTTAAHSTLVLNDTSSSELLPGSLGRRPERVTAERQEANGAHWLEASHDGYMKPFGAIHRRRLYVAESGEDIRGEDVVECATGQSFAVRFHLHPGVSASLQQDGEGALLRLPANGGGWRLRAEGGKLTLEESIFLGGPEPRRTEQVVLTGLPDGAQQVKWAITKVG